ncbi:MAG TPA: heme-binding domain-containing protein [Pyrinomonadaceae bacterium]|nr:heme-binding domain-containing protein [Pyrinomonadaceae bacterium]
MKKVLKWVVIVLVVLFVAAQAYRPTLSTPPPDDSKSMSANTHMTPEVSSILERSCNDCHSSKTSWPWYSQVAPVSWYLKNHVDEGRREFSMSDWGTYPAKKAARKLGEICEQVKKGDMPLKSYLLLHPTAKLSDADRKTLCDWTDGESNRLQSSQTASAQ